MASWDRKTALFTGLGAALAAGAGYVAARIIRNRAHSDRPAAALTHGRPPGPVGNSGNVRAAGTEAMRDPPRNWDEVDEASDESFPASDPAPQGKHVD
jgi:hypothetical protein